MKIRENGHITQDGAILHISEMLKLEETKLFRKGLPRLIPCPICEFDATILINIKKKLSTDLKCGNCHNLVTVRILPSGIYKIRSERGDELVNGTDRRWLNKLI
ncbi:hypothetical protein LCGC14_2082250 [marine sediment metagenome]|uniref:Uncharacterized protein n=1 Tax=marine sediment metagenome TaxID=412755 RepID=A0A0F9F2H2_9ZZZZ